MRTRSDCGVIGGSVSVWWECGVAGKSVKMMGGEASGTH